MMLCPDNYPRHVKCKHIFAIEFAIMKGTLKYIDRLPKEAKNYNGSSTTIVTAAESPKSKSYRDEDQNCLQPIRHNLTS